MFLRIGNEFDGEWNHYSPQYCMPSYPRIVDHRRANGVTSLVTVLSLRHHHLGVYGLDSFGVTWSNVSVHRDAGCVQPEPK